MSSERASVVKRKLQHRGINGDGRPPDWTMAVTAPCRDARSVRPLCQKLQHRGINGDGRPPARHYRASLQRVTRTAGVSMGLRNENDTAQ